MQPKSRGDAPVFAFSPFGSVEPMTARELAETLIVAGLLPHMQAGDFESAAQVRERAVTQAQLTVGVLVGAWDRRVSGQEQRRPAHHRHPATMPRGPVSLDQCPDMPAPNGDT